MEDGATPFKELAMVRVVGEGEYFTSNNLAGKVGYIEKIYPNRKNNSLYVCIDDDGWLMNPSDVQILDVPPYEPPVNDVIPSGTVVIFTADHKKKLGRVVGASGEFAPDVIHWINGIDREGVSESIPVDALGSIENLDIEVDNDTWWDWINNLQLIPDWIMVRLR